MTSGRPPRWRPWRRPDDAQQVPELSTEEVERRVDGRAGDPPSDLVDWTGWVGEPAPETITTPEVAPEVAPTTVVRATGAPSPVNPRRILWRDSAMILIFVVLALLGAQIFLPAKSGTPTDTSIPSGVVTGSLKPGATLPPGVTFGPIIDPSLGIDATPTPIPVITLGPSPSPSPSPKPSPKPTPTPRPTLKSPPASVGPPASPAPSIAETASPSPTAAPASAAPTGT